MKIAIIGTGYVGLVTGACFANAGHRVTCIDVDHAKIMALRSGKVPIFEPGLAETIAEGRKRKFLEFSSEPAVSAAAADVIFIAVGTPAKESDGHADLSHLDLALRDIVPTLRHGCLVVIKSTVPVGTADIVEELIRRLRPQLNFDVASNPEFLRAGSAVVDFKMPDRVVIGTENEEAAARLIELYRTMGIDRSRIVTTQRRSAELIKYAANGFLATKIAFINEIADLCESVNARVGDVALGIGLDRRIGTQFLEAGPGFGGSCFPKDARALVKIGEDYGTSMSIIKAVLDSNENRKRSMAERIRDASGGDLRGRRIALLGLTFKASTDDMRDAPSITLAKALVEVGAIVHAYDPVGNDRAKPLLPPSVRYYSTARAAAREADAVVIVTAWDEFRQLDLADLKQQMTIPLLIDLRNIFSKDQLERSGFISYGIGNGMSWPEFGGVGSMRRKPQHSVFAAREGQNKDAPSDTKIAAAE